MPKFKLASEFSRSLREVALEAALHSAFGFTFVRKFTKEQVRAEWGSDVAEAWEGVVTAIGEFRRAGKVSIKELEGKEEKISKEDM